MFIKKFLIYFFLFSFYHGQIFSSQNRQEEIKKKLGLDFLCKKKKDKASKKLDQTCLKSLSIEEVEKNRNFYVDAFEQLGVLVNEKNPLVSQVNLAVKSDEFPNQVDTLFSQTNEVSLSLQSPIALLEQEGCICNKLWKTFENPNFDIKKDPLKIENCYEDSRLFFVFRLNEKINFVSDLRLFFKAILEYAKLSKKSSKGDVFLNKRKKFLQWYAKKEVINFDNQLECEQKSSTQSLEISLMQPLISSYEMNQDELEIYLQRWKEIRASIMPMYEVFLQTNIENHDVLGWKIDFYDFFLNEFFLQFFSEENRKLFKKEGVEYSESESECVANIIKENKCFLNKFKKENERPTNNFFEDVAEFENDFSINIDRLTKKRGTFSFSLFITSSTIEEESKKFVVSLNPSVIDKQKVHLVVEWAKTSNGDLVQCVFLPAYDIIFYEVTKNIKKINNSSSLLTKSDNDDSNIKPLPRFLVFKPTFTAIKELEHIEALSPLDQVEPLEEFVRSGMITKEEQLSYNNLIIESLKLKEMMKLNPKQNQNK